jgi:hypothetical protein
MIEFFFEVVFQILLEGLFQLIVGGWKALSPSKSPTASPATSPTTTSNSRTGSRSVRNVVTLGLGLALALGLGFLWGRHAKSIGRISPPLAIWFSLFSAAVLGGSAVWRRSTPPTRPFSRLRPWTWTPSPLVRMACINLVGAAGVAWGFAATTGRLR